ncbi:MAG TPA: hypothetical protein VNS79_02185 [Sphingobium sp.]|nr:hypothetical protein [Sphingobium sp.]
MARLSILLACALAGAIPASALAQAKSTPPAAVPSKAEIDRAASNFRVFLSALQSDKIPEVVKSALFACIYANTFSQISTNTDKLLTDRKLDKADHNHVISAMAAVCGVRPGQAPAKK